MRAEVEATYRKISLVFGSALILLLIILSILATIPVKISPGPIKNIPGENATRPPEARKLYPLGEGNNGNYTIFLYKIPTDISFIKGFLRYGDIFIQDPVTGEIKKVIWTSKGIKLINSQLYMNVGYRVDVLRKYLNKEIPIPANARIYIVFKPSTIEYIKNYVAREYDGIPISKVKVSIKKDGSLKIEVK